MKKKILMICYYYPPLSDVGCKRSVAFSKYWKKNGWDPYVLSVKNPDKAYCSIGNDMAPDGVDVTYTYSLLNVYNFFGRLNGLFSLILKRLGIKYEEKNYFYDLFCIPDIFIGWIPHTILKGRKIIRENNIDVIYVSCSPFSSGIIGWYLKKMTGKPLVIDYRDPFGLDISKYQKWYKPVWFRKIVDRWIVGTIIKACDLFTVTTEETKQMYIEQHAFVKNKIHTIYNGFDHSLLNGLSVKGKFDKFTIIYTGNFYYDVKFDYFFEGLGLLKKEGGICAGNFQFLFYGGSLESIQDLLTKYDVIDLVHVRPRISSREILCEIKQSHMQLLRIIQPMISTKLFEGIALNVPFLATVPSGEVEKIVRKYAPGSYIVLDELSETVKLSINKAMTQYRKSKFEDNSVNEFLAIFSRKVQSEKYIELIASITRASLT